MDHFECEVMQKMAHLSKIRLKVSREINITFGHYDNFKLD
jgi:hypothetical protein